MGSRMSLVLPAVLLPLALVACSSPVRLAGPSSPRPAATAAPSFTAPFTGTLKREPGAGSALTWQIDGTLGGEVKGAVRLVLVGQSAAAGLLVDSGQVSVQRSGMAACAGMVH